MHDDGVIARGGQVRVIIITGTMGAGKTTILSEASDILSSAGVIHAAIDLDTLGICHMPDGLARELMFRNLASVWSNYCAAGLRRLLLCFQFQWASLCVRVPLLRHEWPLGVL